MNDIENVIFDVAEALRAPVLILALVALAVILIELGAFVVELARRRRRDYGRLEAAAVEARGALTRGDEVGAKAALRPVAWSTGMARALAFMVDQWGRAGRGDRLAKGLADFDFRSLKRLERTRLLVRAGPALGLMGTLIPLSPALEGLAEGNTEELSDNLRVAFSVTVLGLLIGAIAFGISLVRDRLYGQDLSDLEFVAATLDPDSELAAGARPPRPAGAAAAAPPAPAGAAVTNKPPPPKDAKPLGGALPPPPAPAGGSGSPSPTPAATGDGSGTPPAPMPTGGQSAEASPPSAAAPSAPPVPGSEEPKAPPAPPPPPPPPPAADAPQAPPVPGSEPQAPPVPDAPAGDPPTQQLPPTGGDRPTQASNPQPGDGHGSPDPAPENR